MIYDFTPLRRVTLLLHLLIKAYPFCGLLAVPCVSVKLPCPSRLALDIMSRLFSRLVKAHSYTSTVLGIELFSTEA